MGGQLNPYARPAMMSAPEHVVSEMRDDVVCFRLHDPQEHYRAVGLLQELRRPRDWMPLQRRGDIWELDFPRLPVDRMEYQFKGVLADGSGDEVFCDPANPLRAPGAFGEKSVLQAPRYRPPVWASESPAGLLLRASLPSRTLRGEVDVAVWSSPEVDVEDDAPLLVAHDGPEYAELSSLLGFAAHMTDRGVLPAMRVALLQPPWPRDEHYSASAAYARALVTEILPALEWLAPTGGDRRQRVAMGASLGALALLHAHRLRPQAFGGLFLQSGSYFRQRYDRQESGFPRFRRISRFVGSVLNAESFADPVPVVLTCGTVEENLPNNRAVTAALQRQGYDARLAVNRDAHNYVGWRDTFDPHLCDLLAKVW